MIKRINRFLLSLVVLLFIERFCHSQTEGFSLQKIKRQCQGPIFEKPLPEELKTVLSKPFHYLASGGESYVFCSEDGQYVLKFFKHHHLKEKSLLDHFSKKYPRKRERKRDEFFTSLFIAYHHLREQTGFVYLHLGTTENLLPSPLTLYDPLKSPHTIDLGQYDFALQQRGELALNQLKKRAEKGDDIAPYFGKVFNLLTERYALGIGDKDPVFKRNLGLKNDKPFLMDLGCFYWDPSLKKLASAHRALFFETLKFSRWIHKNIPEYGDVFDTNLTAFLNFSQTEEPL